MLGLLENGYTEDKVNDDEKEAGFMRGRRMLVSAIAAAAMILALASTAYACVVIKGKGTVTGSVRAGNELTGLGTNVHASYCTSPGSTPVTAAAGPASSSVSASFSPATLCNADGTNKLSDGTYDVRLRNLTGANTAYTGTDGTSWTFVSGKGCFATSVGGSNYALGTLTVSGGTGISSGGPWTIPSTVTSNSSNPKTDTSVFCIGNRTLNGDLTQDGFLAPFRVSTV